MTKTIQQDGPNISVQAATAARIPPQAGELEDRLLPKVFLLSHVPAGWSVWQLALFLLGAAAVVWLTWQALAGTAALTAALLYLLFAASDWLLFWWLPRSRRSF